jgi:hypothetical protein
MRFRSTGLGPTELKGKITRLAPVGKDLLVLHINTYTPVEWHLKAAIQRKDVRRIIKNILKPSILFHITRCLFYLKNDPKEIQDIMDKSISV